jgi:hypothetical protein
MKFDNEWKIFGTDIHGKNKLLLDSSKLLTAALARNVNNPTGSGILNLDHYKFKGIQFHAIGSGDPNWHSGFYASGVDLSSSGLTYERQREVPGFCRFVTDFVSTAESGSTNQIIDGKLTQFTPSDINGLILYVGSGTNNGNSGTLTYTPDPDVLTNDVPVNVVYVTPALPSGTDYTSVYEIRNAPVHDQSIANKVRIKTTFTHSGTESYTIREHGLFGANATETLNSGLIFNHVILSGTTEEVIFGPGSGTTLEFVMKLQ